MTRIDKYLFKTLKLVLVALATICFFLPQTQAATYTLVKTIDLNPLVGDNHSIEVDVVGHELYAANWHQDKYFRINPVTGDLLGSFSLGNGILMDNHGSEYDPNRGSIFHASDAEGGGSLSFDAFFETDTTGVVLSGPYDLYGAENSADPNGLTVDPVTGRIWVSTVGPDGIHEINPSDGTILNHIVVGEVAWALGFNPNSEKLFFADGAGVIKEVAPDGTGLATVFDPGVGEIYGMAFTPSGDLALLDFGTSQPPSRVLLYDSSDDADDVFTTTALVGYWNFDENTGTTTHDSSGYGNDGQITDASWIPGKCGSALSFDGGANSSIDYVVVPNSPSIDTSEFTVSGWVSLADVNRTNVILDKRNDQWDRNFGLYYYVNESPPSEPTGNYLAILIGDGTPVNWYEYAAYYLHTPNQDQFFHIAATHHHSDGHSYLRLYLNGVMVAERELSEITGNVGNGDLYIGTHGYPQLDMSPTNGIIDEVRIYNHALTKAEIHADMVECSLLFGDVPPGYWAEDYIYKIYNAGITTGCSTEPLRYCPTNPTNRTQMAVFLERGINGGSYIPPPATGLFYDVPLTWWAVDWIEQFYNDGITSGCRTTPLMYCPVNPVTRTQMAIFLLRAKHGSNYVPPAATGIFDDVPLTWWAVDWIEQLYREGITTGCSTNPLRYCPTSTVNRAQMAAFIVRTFGL